jgi:hypothetical protein
MIRRLARPFGLALFVLLASVTVSHAQTSVTVGVSTPGAQIDLSYTKVLAPDDGLAGRTEVYAGTLVGRGQSTLLTRISRIDSITPKEGKSGELVFVKLIHEFHNDRGLASTNEHLSAFRAGFLNPWHACQH